MYIGQGSPRAVGSRTDTRISLGASIPLPLDRVGARAQLGHSGARRLAHCDPSNAMLAQLRGSGR